MANDPVTDSRPILYPPPDPPPQPVLTEAQAIALRGVLTQLEATCKNFTAALADLAPLRPTDENG